MSMLSPSNLERKFLLIPNPKDVVIWRTNAADAIKKIRRFSYGFPRELQRSRSGKPVSSKSIDIHLWRLPLDGWVPEEMDYIAIVENGTSLVWTVKSVSTGMEGVLYICRCEQSTIESSIRDTVTQYIQSGSTSLVQY